MKSTNRSVPVMLTIAGSDNSGGAGIQADLKTASALGVYGTSAVTCVVAEHPGSVQGIHPLPPAMVALQIRSTMEAFPIDAIKTGMLYSGEIIQAVVESIRSLACKIPLVVDPVMVATSGKPLLQEEAMDLLKRYLLPLATLVTPNRDEAALLWGKPIESVADLEKAGVELVKTYGVSFLVKGGHLQGDRAVDLLCSKDGVKRFEVARVPGINPHGTGCTFSAAIASGLASGLSLEDAVDKGKRFITSAIERHYSIGKYLCLNHHSAS